MLLNTLCKPVTFTDHTYKRQYHVEHDVTISKSSSENLKYDIWNKFTQTHFLFSLNFLATEHNFLLTNLLQLIRDRIISWLKPLSIKQATLSLVEVT